MNCVWRARRQYIYLSCKLALEVKGCTLLHYSEVVVCRVSKRIDQANGIIATQLISTVSPQGIFFTVTIGGSAPTHLYSNTCLKTISFTGVGSGIALYWSKITPSEKENDHCMPVDSVLMSHSWDIMFTSYISSVIQSFGSYLWHFGMDSVNSWQHRFFLSKCHLLDIIHYELSRLKEILEFSDSILLFPVLGYSCCVSFRTMPTHCAMLHADAGLCALFSPSGRKEFVKEKIQPEAYIGREESAMNENFKWRELL